MCLTLYLGTRRDQPLFRSTHLSVEEVEPAQEVVRQWLTLPVVRYIGSFGGCSCSFRNVIASEPVDYDDLMFLDEDDDERRSLEELLAMVRAHVDADGEAELLPAWDGEEGKPLLGTIHMTADALRADRFVFVQQFLYRVTRASG